MTEQKRGPGRPPGTGHPYKTERQSVQLPVKLTPAKMEAWKAAAIARHVSLSDLVRMSVEKEIIPTD
jgi:hypothetical protein